MSSHEVNDLLVVKNTEKKGSNFLCRVKKDNGTLLEVTLERDRHLKTPVVIEIKPQTILLNLGTSPEPGNVYGVDVSNVWFKTLNHDGWGDIHFLHKISKPLLDKLKENLDKTHARMEKLGLEKVFHTFHTEVRYKTGKYAGLYHHRPKLRSSIELFLKDEHAGSMPYVLFHELGHAIRYNFIRSPGVYAAWLRMFNKSIDVSPVSGAEAQTMLKSILKTGGTLGEYAKDLEDENKASLRTIIRHIRQVHRVSAKQFDVLLKSGKTEVIEDLWPTRSVDTTDLNPIVSDYACKNVEELWAEAFAFRMTGRKIPKSIDDLLDRSLTHAKDKAASFEIADAEEQGDADD